MSFFRSFYVRLSLVFLALILILAVLHARIAANVFDRQREEIDQRANAMLAADMAKEIEPYIGAGEEGDGEALGSAIHYMMVLNPLIEIYLISGTGEILSYFADTSTTVQLERVDIEPVRAFLGRDDPFPIYGDDPRRPDEATTFSAAPLKVPGGGDGYVYVVLRSSLYDSARSEIEDEYFRAAFRESLFYTLPLVALLGLLVFFLLTYRLQGLTNVVRAFGNGAYDVRATVASRDEVGELAASFNLMARQIESSVEAIERAERERRDLVANISHDLRTPLSSIRGYIETLLHREPSLSAEDRKKYLEISLSSAEALGRLVDDLFELSRLERADQGINSEVFSLSELCHDIVMQFALPAERQQVTVRLDPPTDLFLISGDISLMERTLTNLIENAVHHSPPESVVEVGLKASEGTDTSGMAAPSVGPASWVTVSISDEGPGLSGEERERVFQRYYTGSAGGAGRGGLGLAIARRIVELHGGMIGVRNKPGGGSIFSFTVPL